MTTPHTFNNENEGSAEIARFISKYLNFPPKMNILKLVSKLMFLFPRSKINSCHKYFIKFFREITQKIK